MLTSADPKERSGQVKRCGLPPNAWRRQVRSDIVDRSRFLGEARSNQMLLDATRFGQRSDQVKHC